MRLRMPIASAAPQQAVAQLGRVGKRPAAGFAHDLHLPLDRRRKKLVGKVIAQRAAAEKTHGQHSRMLRVVKMLRQALGHRSHACWPRRLCAERDCESAGSSEGPPGARAGFRAHRPGRRSLRQHGQGPTTRCKRENAGPRPALACAVQRALRPRVRPKPARATPSRASVPGSGTAPGEKAVITRT